MTPAPTVENAANRPSGHRAVPLLTEPELGHYPEFRRFFTDSFGLADDRVGAPGLVRVGDRFYELVFLGRSGRPFPSGVEVHALVPGLEPLDEGAADRDLWSILEWVVSGVGGEWTVDALTTTGRIYRVPAVSAGPAAPDPAPAPRGEAVALDLYGTLVDPLAIAAALERTMPRPAAQLVAATWRRTQIEYAFRLTVMNRYRDFAELTERSLEFALLEHGQPLGRPERAALLERYNALEPFPDVLPALQALAGAGIEIAVLSNGSPSMLEACLSGGGLRRHIPRVISVDAVGVYKPHPDVYRLAAAEMDRPIDEIRLVSCNPFDIVGAAAAGMRTAWINRSSARFDTLGVQPDVTISSLAELLGVLDPPAAPVPSPPRIATDPA